MFFRKISICTKTHHTDSQLAGPYSELKRSGFIADLAAMVNERTHATIESN